MKQSYLLLLAFLTFSFTQAQIVNIPDANFKNALIINGVDINMDGEIQVSEAEVVLALDLSNRYITSLQGIEAFNNLINLNCSRNQLITLDLNSLSNLNYLKCYRNDLTELNINNLTNLIKIECNFNQLTTLDVNGLVNLTHLLCNDNQLHTINMSGCTNLTELNCDYNQLISLDVTSLPNLNELYCSNNQLTSLEVAGSSSLTRIICEENQLSSLNLNGLSNLTRFACGRNNLTEIDLNELPSLIQLSIYENQLTELDVSSLTNLYSLNCSYNQLTELDVSDLTNLEYLTCSSNQITSLDLSEITEITQLSIGYNPIRTLNIKNNRLDPYYYISELPNLEFICVDDIELESMKARVEMNGYTNCVVNSYCSFVPGGEYFTIQGENKIDIDANGCNTSDPNFPYLKFNITDGNVNGTIISNATGNYSIPIHAGTHTITPILENPSYFTVTPSNVVVDFPTEASPYNQDFCVVPNGVYNDLEITIMPIDQARPGFDTDYKIVYKNKGNSTLSGNVYLAFQDDLMSFVVANPPNESGLIDLLSWDFSNLLPFESRSIEFTMNLNTPTDTPPLNGDDVLLFTATVNPVSGDEMPEDNMYVLNQTVVNSFDPNDKTCLEGKTITPEQVGKFVHYMIRFENTGTASAVNVVVKDEIDTDKYDVASLIPMDASHEFVTRIKEDNIVEFIFENINLPFDDANNDGYVLFKIKTLPSLSLGDEFSNDAEIYFDYNAPIITNDELTTVAENLSIEASEIQTVVSMYPNPVSDYLNVKSKESLKQIAIYDIQGRQIRTIALTGNTKSTKVDLSSLSKGVYFVKIKTEIGEQTSKIIKE